MLRPSVLEVKQLFEILDDAPEDWKPIWRYFLTDPKLAWVWEEKVRRPELEEILACCRWLRREAKEHLNKAFWFLAGYPKIQQLNLELELDLLVDLPAKKWTHPVQVRPLPQLISQRELLDACNRRLEVTNGSAAEHLQTVRAKLARAVVIEERAAKRRAKLAAQKQAADGGE